MSLRFDQSTSQRLRRALLRKGQAIATELAELLAGTGKGVQVAELPVSARKPGMRPEERLRAFLDHVEGCRQRLDADDDRFGRCTACQTDLGLVALTELPWADRCAACGTN